MADVTKEFFSVIKKDSTSENPFKYTIGRTQIIDLFTIR